MDRAILDRDHLPFSESDEQLKGYLLNKLFEDEKELITRQEEASYKRSKTPRDTQYDEEISYTNGALSEIWRIRALIKEWMK